MCNIKKRLFCNAVIHFEIHGVSKEILLTEISHINGFYYLTFHVEYIIYILNKNKKIYFFSFCSKSNRIEKPFKITL